MLRKILINSAVVLASIIIVLLFLEASFRLLGVEPQTITVRGQQNSVKESLVLPYHDIDGGLSVQTPEGPRNRRNVEATITNHYLSKKDTKIFLNSHGFRYSELADKTDKDFRVLVLGDSITWAEFVNEDETYPAIIERYLKERNKPKGKNVQVINAGVGAIDMAAEYSILMETGLSVKPDIVLVGLYLNDAYHLQSVSVARTPALVDKSYLLNFLFRKIDVLRGVIKYNVVQFKGVNKDIKEARERFAAEYPASDADWLTDRSGFNGAILKNFRDWGFSWTPEYWERIEETLLLMMEAGRKNGFELAVILFPIRHQVYSDIYRNEPQLYFEALMKKHGVKHLDILPLLRQKYYASSIDVYYDHCHMTPEGYRMVGEAIAGFLVP